MLEYALGESCQPSNGSVMSSQLWLLVHLAVISATRPEMGVKWGNSPQHKVWFVSSFFLVVLIKLDPKVDSFLKMSILGSHCHWSVVDLLLKCYCP